MTSSHGPFLLFGLVEWKLLSFPGCDVVSLWQLYGNPGSFRIGAQPEPRMKEKLMMFNWSFNVMHPFLRIIGLNSVTWPKTAAREAGSFLWTWEYWWMQSKGLAHGAEVTPLPSVLRGPFIVSCREEASQWFYCRCLSFLGVNHISWHYFFFFGLFVFKESFFVFLSVLASKFCSSVCCFPQAPLPLFFPKIPLAHNHYCWKTLLISNG